MQQVKLLLILGILSFISCKKSSTDINNSDVNIEIDSLKMYGFHDSELEDKIYDIQGKGVYLRDGPGEIYKKLVNQKATDAIGEMQYMEVDYTCTVSILEEKNNWAKVKVVEPSHLSSTHYGWIPLKNIVKDINEISSLSLSQFEYEIISTSENNVSKTYNIYLNINNLSKDKISNFIKQFRDKNCSNCTINIFDSKSIKGLVNVYPLSKDQYLKFADHFVAWSTFDVPKNG